MKINTIVYLLIVFEAILYAALKTGPNVVPPPP